MSMSVSRDSKVSNPRARFDIRALEKDCESFSLK